MWVIMRAEPGNEEKRKRGSEEDEERGRREI
jgi:hypothetical protein